MTARRRARAGWFRAVRGRAGQPGGRHTAEYVAAHRDGTGLFPQGQACRVHPGNDEVGDRGDNDRHGSKGSNG